MYKGDSVKRVLGRSSNKNEQNKGAETGMVQSVHASRKISGLLDMSAKLIGSSAGKTFTLWKGCRQEFLFDLSQSAIEMGLIREALALDLWLLDREESLLLCARAFQSAVDCAEVDIARFLFTILDDHGVTGNEDILSLASLEVSGKRFDRALTLLHRVQSSSLMKKRLLTQVLLCKKSKDAKYVAVSLLKKSLRNKAFRLEQFIDALLQLEELKNDRSFLRHLLSVVHEDNLLPLLSYLARDNFLDVADRSTIDRLSVDVKFWQNRIGKSIDRNADLFEVNDIYFNEGMGGLAYDQSVKGLAGLQSTSAMPETSAGIVSIIICAYNATDTIEFSIRSVAAQNYSNLEIIVIDDCSDEPITVDPNWVADRPLKVHRNSVNMGPYLSRNVGIERAEGDYIGFHDADDWAHPDKTSHQIKLMIETGAVAHFGGHIRMNPDGVFIPENNGRFVGDGPVTGLFHRSVFKHCGKFTQTRTRGDIEFRRRITRLLGEQVIAGNSIPYIFALDWNSNSKKMTNTLAKEIAMQEFLRRSERAMSIARFVREPEQMHLVIDNANGASLIKHDNDLPRMNWRLETVLAGANQRRDQLAIGEEASVTPEATHGRALGEAESTKASLKESLTSKHEARFSETATLTRMAEDLREEVAQLTSQNAELTTNLRAAETSLELTETKLKTEISNEKRVRFKETTTLTRMIETQQAECERKKRPLEVFLIKQLVRSEKKLNKYHRNRTAFFSESRSTLVRAYFRLRPGK